MSSSRICLCTPFHVIQVQSWTQVHQALKLVLHQHACRIPACGFLRQLVRAAYILTQPGYPVDNDKQVTSWRNAHDDIAEARWRALS